MKGSLRRTRRGFAILGGLFLLFVGCGDDNDTPIFECSNCENWTELLQGHAKFGDYRPGGTDVIAFSSDRGTAGNTENVWIYERPAGDAEAVYHQLTQTSTDDFDPAWSPDGDRLTFTRATTGGYELYLLRVDDFDNPGDEIRITATDFSDTALVSRPASSAWLDDETILYSDGQNVFTIRLDGETPAEILKVINDPSDFIFSGTDDFVENQPTGVRVGGADQIFFVSNSRVPLGSISINASDVVTGDTVLAEIHLEGVPTGVIAPSVVGGRPLGSYLVGAGVTDEDEDEDYCDTLLTVPVQVFENDTTDVDFEFDNSRGVIRMLARPLNANFYYDGRQQTSIRTDTTFLDCVFPGLHEVKIVSITMRDSVGEFLRDSVWATVAEFETLEVVLDVSGQKKRSYENGSSMRVRPERLAGKNQDLFQVDRDQVLWRYNGEEGSYSAVSDDREYPTFPAVDPTGELMVYVVDFNSLKIVSLVDEQEWWIPLPGATGVNVCFREVAFPSWSEDGTKILVSLTPCLDQPSTDHNASEYNIWEVDVGARIGR